MATIKVSELTALTGTPDSSDFLPIVDASANETKKITVDDLFSFSNVLFDSAINASNAILAQKAYAADSATRARESITSLRSVYADSAINASIALFAETSGLADSALTANFAFTAKFADSAQKATEAIYALRADSADAATFANNALRAINAINADSAINASNAIYALGADSAYSSQVSGFATTAYYTPGPGGAALWTLPLPLTADSAIDRIATVVVALNGGGTL